MTQTKRICDNQKTVDDGSRSVSEGLRDLLKETGNKFMQTQCYIYFLYKYDHERNNTSPVNTSMTNANVDVAKYLLLKGILKDKLYQFSVLVEHYLGLKEIFHQWYWRNRRK